MKFIQNGMIAIALTLSFDNVSVMWAADTHDKASNHVMVDEPNNLKWVDVPTLPPGAKVAVIEGPPSEAVPFMMRLKFPANYKVPHTGIQLLSISPCSPEPSTWASAIRWM